MTCIRVGYMKLIPAVMLSIVFMYSKLHTSDMRLIKFLGYESQGLTNFVIGLDISNIG